MLLLLKQKKINPKVDLMSLLNKKVLFCGVRFLYAEWSNGRIPGSEPGGGGSTPPSATNYERMIFQLKFKRAAYRFLFLIVLSSVCILIMLFSVSAADPNGNTFVDLYDYSSYSFSDNNTVVHVNSKFPTDWIQTLVYEDSFSGNHYIETLYGDEVKLNYWVVGTHLLMRPLGGNVHTGDAVGSYIKNANILDISVIPDQSSFSSTLIVRVSSDDIIDTSALFDGYQVFYFVDENGQILKRINKYMQPTNISTSGTYYEFVFSVFADFESLGVPDGAVGLLPIYTLADKSSDVDYKVESVRYQPYEFSFAMSDLEYQVSQNNAMREKLNSIQDAMDEQNNKMDEIISGGSAGDELGSAGDDMLGAVGDLNDSVADLEEFEDQYMDQFDDNIDDVIAGADISFLYVPLAFVQRYLNKIIAGVPREYLVVLTLPLFLGIFMYAVGHPVRVPRPDRSSDQVTRETFTTTQILAGPRSGQVRSTRTVTTSRVIRSDNEE